MVRMQDRTETQATNFNAIRISVASPEQIINWSHGEVTKPETINYRTLRPEKDGLFCERLFGPTKDWECFCGKYKRIRYRGVVCDRCGVEVTRAKVRRERMGHIRLAAPVAHIWFAKTTPSRLGTLLDLSPRNLERVLYFAQHIVIAVDDEQRNQFIEEEQARFDLDLEKLQKENAGKLTPLRERQEELELSDDSGDAVGGMADTIAIQSEIEALLAELDGEEKKLRDHLDETITELEDLRPLKILSESRYRHLKDRYGDVFQAGMGAEAILEILRTRDLEAIRDELVTTMRSTSGQRRTKAIKRLRVVESFRRSGNRIEDIILTVLPVLPPELRPMVQLDGGRFATSDLNDLYRRVINRNNRLKRLMDLGAPEIIIRNEKRMLQESVDALIDNGRRGRPVSGSHNHKLKSLSDLLRGKQGRFRQNLLGKRVDYSGRSVIVVGPELKMDQCGLPKRMALELFKPFVMHKLVMLGLSPNIKSAKRMVERARPEVWDILENVIKDRPVLLNRAPTLHRLGIQAFMPVLIEGHAIQLHPLVCSAFNADFDGDQMAVHVPLSRMAVHEAKTAMLSTHNMLSPASGEPLVSPTLDMVMGCYYLTEIQSGAKGEGKRFYGVAEARSAYADGLVDLRALITVRDVPGCQGWVQTSVGRLLFNEVLPDSIGFKNEIFNSGKIRELTAELHQALGNKETAETLDALKSLGFKYATNSGTTVAINDIQISSEKAEIVREAVEDVAGFANDYEFGLMDDAERYEATIRRWTVASDEIERRLINRDLREYGGIGMMAQSGAKGNIAQIKQMAGWRGLITRPSRDLSRQTIELPIRSSYREGLSSLEYFISSHGARKGLTDTALNTANSGYMTRRLVDISQELIILEEDCGTYNFTVCSPRPEDPNPNDPDQSTLKERILGRVAVSPVISPATGEILVDRGTVIDQSIAYNLVDAGILQVPVRSPLTCEARRGVCQVCYGYLPASGELVEFGQAVGIIAAQSIGEPGTQLTMRTFHSGGVARRFLFDVPSDVDGEVCEVWRIYPRSTKIWEIDVAVEVHDRIIQSDADLQIGGHEQPVIKGATLATVSSRVDGLVWGIETRSDGRREVEIREYREHQVPSDAYLQVGEGRRVKKGDTLVTVVSRVDGEVRGIGRNTGAGIRKVIVFEKVPHEHIVPSGADLKVAEGQQVEKWAVLATFGEDDTPTTILSQVDGEVRGIDQDTVDGSWKVTVVDELSHEHSIRSDATLQVQVGQRVEKGATLAAVLSEFDGLVWRTAPGSDGSCEVTVVSDLPHEHSIQPDADLQVGEGQWVKRGDTLAAVLSEFDGQVRIESRSDGRRVVKIAVGAVGEEIRRHTVRSDDELSVANNLDVEVGQRVKKGDRLATAVRATDITGGTSGLPRVEELFEARIPKNAAILSEIDGEAQVDQDAEGRMRVRIVNREEYREEYDRPEGVQLLVEPGDDVEPGMLLAATLPDFSFEEDTGDDYEPEPIREVVASVGGRVEISPDTIAIVWEDEEVREYAEGREIPPGAYLLVSDGDQVNAGRPLTAGPLNPHDILNIQGSEELQRYLVDEVQRVYRNQGVGIHDKHIEVILRQMLRRVQVDSIGDTDFIPGQMVDKFDFQEKNGKVLAEGGEPATGKPILLGVTRASLLTDSFLAAASFQETTRVLTQAAISGSYDQLMGLKENVIIGRLIPAQIASAAYVEEPEPELLEMPDLPELLTAGWLGEGDGGTGMAFGPGAGAPAGYYEEEPLDFDEDDEDEDDWDDDDEEDEGVVATAPAAEQRSFAPEPEPEPQRNLSGLPSFLRNRDGQNE